LVQGYSSYQMQLNVVMRMALLVCASILFLVQEVASVRHVKAVSSKPPLKLKLGSKKPDAAGLNKVEAPSLKVRVPTKVSAKPSKKSKSKSAEIVNPATCFDISAGAVMNVQSFKEQFSNKSFLLSLTPGAADPSGEKALTTLYEAMLGDCGSGAPFLVDVGAGSGQVAAVAASKGCRVSAFDPDVNSVQSLKTSRCLNRWTDAFTIYPTMAAATLGGNVTVLPASHSVDSSTKSKDNIIHGVSLDGVFVKGDERKYSLDKSEEPLDTLKGDVSVLKITPQGCCAGDSVLKALQGAKKLLASGRVQCLAMEMAFENTTEYEIDILRLLEERGYHLAHTGPSGSVALEVSKSGAYVLYATDTKQLDEIQSTLRRIRTFDERSGLRAYGNGISLNREGKFFEYSEMVFACKSGYPDQVEVRPVGKTRFGNGMWWIEQQNSTKPSTKKQKK